jgi:uncharacterized protein (TIGR02594 family)
MMYNPIDYALSQYGLKEVSGTSNNPEIMKFFHEIGHSWVQGDETAWCSAFVNWCCLKSGAPMSGKLNARSWLTVGAPIADDPMIGDIAVFWRESPQSWKGHVGFFIRDDGDFIWVLGGNQNNQVNISPYRKSRLLQYRRV